MNSESSKPTNVGSNDQLGRGPARDMVDRLRTEADAWDAGSGDMAALLREAATELEKTRESAHMISGMFSRNCVAMQAAVADMVLRGDKQGWQWIINTLDGPGLLPDMDQVKAAGGAQAWFDAELAAEEARVAALNKA